jgi:hypothetical protein
MVEPRHGPEGRTKLAGLIPKTSDKEANAEYHLEIRSERGGGSRDLPRKIREKRRKVSREMQELNDTKRHTIRDCVDFGAKTAAVKRLVVLTTAFVLAVSLLMLGGITRSAEAQDAALLLPDLRMGSIQDMKVREYPDGRRLLRFSALMVNVGAGPFELRGQHSDDTDTATLSVAQRIYDDAGGYRDIPRSATMFYSGDGHDHWHVKDAARYTLRQLGGSGQVREGAKEGFCFFDVWPYDLTLPGAPESKHYSASNSCGGSEHEGASQVKMGLSVGWTDIYPYVLPFQWIDITGLPSGTYLLRALIDSGNQFKESRQANNYTWVKIELEGEKAKVLKEGPTPRYCGRGQYC